MTLSSVGIVGGGGFIGSHVVGAVRRAGGTPVVISQVEAPHLDCEVRIADAFSQDDIDEALHGCDSVIHLAARAGGIQMQHSAELFRENRAVTDNVLEACAANGIEDVFLASSQVVYRDCASATDEGAPIVSSVDAPSQYAWSKATDEVVGRWWGEDGDRRVVIGRFGNVYGPGASYDPSRSTVVHALIRRFSEAARGSIVDVWGDGSAVRSFTYVQDAADAVVAILERGESGAAYNIDSGIPVSIRELAESINQLVDSDLTLHFDASKPVGVPFRVGSVERISGIGFEPRMAVEEGLAATIADFDSRRKHKD